MVLVLAISTLLVLLSEGLDHLLILGHKCTVCPVHAKVSTCRLLQGEVSRDR